MNASGIYEIVNTVNGKRYVGSSAFMGGRFATHRRALESSSHGNRHLQRAWNKHGAVVFQFRPLLLCAPKNLLFYEQRAINATAPDRRYNLSPTAGSPLGTKHTKETLAKMSAASKGKKKSALHCANISAAQQGKIFSADHKAGLRNTWDSVWRDPAKRSSRIALGWVKRRALGRGKHTPEARLKIALGLLGNQNLRGKKFSASTRAKMSAASLGKIKSQEHRTNITLGSRAMWADPVKRAALLASRKDSFLRRKLNQEHPE